MAVWMQGQQKYMTEAGEKAMAEEFYHFQWQLVIRSA